MLKFFRTHYLNLSVGFALTTLMFLFFSHSRKEYGYVLGDFVQKITQPIAEVSLSLVDWVKDHYKIYIALSDAQVQNLALQNQILTLKTEILNLKEQTINLPKYEKALQFLVSSAENKIYASTVAELQTDYSQVLLINRGEKDGVKKNQGVVEYQGIVGKVIRVTTDKALVMLITDLQSKIPVILSKNRTRAFVQGDGKGNLLLKLLPREEKIEVGDKIITSGITSIFPSGYEVGTIEEIYKKEFGWFQEAKVRPAVELKKMEDVFVLKNTGNKEMLDSITR